MLAIVSQTKNNFNLSSSTECNICGSANCLIHNYSEILFNSELSSRSTVLKCKKGQQFIIEGAPVNGLFFIKSGTVKVFRTGINGREQIVRFARACEIVGHRGFGTQEYYSIGAIALQNVELHYFSKEFLQEVLINNPDFTYAMMLFYANELNRSENKVKSISQMTVRERVVDTILYINRKFGEVNGFLNLPLSRKEYADYAGTSEEQVIRVFSTLKKEGLIKANGKKIGISDIELLRKEISEHNFFLDS
ncbi:Crp/Fnr family transcriptional regulator [Seonamhaeicola aphaedonensis]|uniref:CRP-like cAMP-binding protein n=1 Tax=Seonamhaeicola aphaedonensis TaxID=1461338 RepID=A0A3D9H5W7_9FLAO|nr:Crp/Fnr family transcriptional regulator [Seonamhaeicola aphaedonensis]RED44895.1 CRP-like cAMP-binding protein [Seonamhaeicola aphaedonensis]